MKFSKPSELGQQALRQRLVLPFHCAERAWGRKLEWLKKMLVAILILVVSFAALIQFAAFAWRAAFLSVATAELREDLAKYPIINSFEEASAYERLCPELTAQNGGKLISVSAYHSMLQLARSIGDSILPPAAGWAQREMALCTRYATVTLARRMERNQIAAAELSSF
jgi:hypothetical protein